MKKIITILLICLFLFTGCFDKEKKEEKMDDNREKIIEDDEQDGELSEIDKKVKETMSKMTLDEKIGQMIVVTYESYKMDNTLKNALIDVQPGGFLLFAENVSTYEETLKLIKEIKSYVKIPMFISIDEEGGSIQRLLKLKDYNITNIPFMYDIGSLDDLDITYNVGKVLAEELRVFGINLDFAPVIDVYSNKDNTVIGKRSFGTTPELVSKHGLSLAKGLEDNGVIAVYKHFPGHGNTAVDSHENLPIVNKTKDELLKNDLIPFIDAINNNASVIMIGHLAVPNITKDNTPASLSKALITDFLKNELNYSGLVVTDALNMKALTNYYSDEEICGKAVEAGVDILLMPSSSRKCLKSVQNALRKGLITEERINQSVEKILRLKYEKIVDNYEEYLPVDILGSEEHQKMIKK